MFCYNIVSMLDALLTPFYIWLFIMILCVLLELFMLDFFLICFSIAAGLTALVFKLIAISFFWQIGLFCLLSITCFVFVRPITKKWVFIKSERKKMGAEAYVDGYFIVMEEINNVYGTGKIKIGGEVWRAQSLDNSLIKRGQSVQVKGVLGSTLVVIMKRL